MTNRKINLTKRTVKFSRGFTIVELLVVIVIIGILAAITMVSYSGISSKAKIATVQSDLTNNSNILKMYNATYGSYPTAINASNCPTAPITDNNYCLKASSGSTLIYTNIVSSDFHLTATNGSASYSTNSANSPSVATSASSCPTGYIPVPGSGTYGTNDFCVMKYEAKIQGNDNGNQTYSSAFVPESRVSGTPWVNISQTNAIAEAQTACASCHLITEAEWMTLAQNVLSVVSNWSGGAVGSGFIYSGNNDGAPTSSLAASSDLDGYYGTGDTTGSNQKRTLALTNGEIIWDLAGNADEWTSGTSQTPVTQPGIIGANYALREWTAITNSGTLPINPSPTNTGLVGASTWNSASGIGKIYSSSDEIGLRSFVHGGTWGAYFNAAGVLSLDSSVSPGDTAQVIGFRAAVY